MTFSSYVVILGHFLLSLMCYVSCTLCSCVSMCLELLETVHLCVPQTNRAGVAEHDVILSRYDLLFLWFDACFVLKIDISFSCQTNWSRCFYYDILNFEKMTC